MKTEFIATKGFLKFVRYSGRLKRTLATLPAACALAGCSRAPTFNILGSFFPSWLVCMCAGAILAVVTNRIFVYFNIDKDIVWTIIVYPCLALFFACTIWLILFS